MLSIKPKTLAACSLHTIIMIYTFDQPLEAAEKHRYFGGEIDQHFVFLGV